MRAAAGLAAQPVAAARPLATRQQQRTPAAAQAAEQQRQPRPWQQQQQRRRPLAAAAAGGGDKRVLAAGGDVGDEFEDMMDRREELLRQRDEEGDEGGLNADEDEELADLTARLLQFGYLEDTGALSDEDDDDEASTSDDDVAALYLEDEDEEASEEEGSEEEDEDAVGRRGRAAAALEEEEEEEEEEPLRRASKRGQQGADDSLDIMVSEAQAGGTADMRNMGMFETSSPGVGEEAEGEAAEDRYPPLPQRSYRLPQLLRLAGLEEQAASAPDLEISALLTCNSITPAAEGGALYVCVPSTDGAHDGHDWADEAVDAGAVAVLAERPLPNALLPVVVVPDTLRALSALADAFYERPSRRMRTVGLVGSYGKTTTAWLARGMFEETNELCGMTGTIEYAVAEDRLTEEGELWAPDAEDVTLQRDCSTPFHYTPYEGKYPEVPTTPDALHLHKVLAGQADRGAATSLLELDPTTLVDGRAANVNLDVLVYTNTTPDGEAAAGGAEAYAANIRSLFSGLTDPDRQRAVINIDDPLGAELAARTAGHLPEAVLTYSLSSRDAAVFAEKVKNTIWETEVLVNTPLGRLQIITPMLGRHAAYNILAAVSLGIACGVPLKAIVAGIEAVDIVPGRCEIIDEGQPFAVVVDSASTPEQLGRLLDDVKEAGAKRVLLVFGCPGSTSKEHRAAMMRVAHFKADAVYVTNDSPGVDWPNDIITDMTAGLPDEVVNEQSGSVYPWLQDPHRVPPWYQKYMLQYQSLAGIYVIEDRFQAIRVAIGMAQQREVVLVVGKGHKDYQEIWDGNADGFDATDSSNMETCKSWFDDRVECRNALSKLSYLTGVKDLKRDYLPWTRYPEERDILEREGVTETNATINDY